MRVSILMDLLCPDDEAPDAVGVPLPDTIEPEAVAPDEFNDPQLYVPGAWHARGGGHLKRALSWVGKDKPSLLPLARVLLPRLPCYLLSSSTLKTEKPRSGYAPMDKAIRHQWLGMQAKQQKHINVLTLDCDKEGWRERLDALVARGLPRPTFVVVSPARWEFDANGMPSPMGRGYDTAHLSWLLSHPVCKANRMAFDLFTRTRQALIRELDADTRCAGHIGKCPFHDAYVTEVGALEPTTLGDLNGPMIDFCGADEHWLGKRTVSRNGGRAYQPGCGVSPELGHGESETAPWGRHFEVRHKVYAAGVTDYEVILAMTRDYAAESGSKAKHRQIETTATSIHKHMLSGRFGSGARRPGVNHGAMSREHSTGSRPIWRGLSKKEKQGEAGLRSAAIRRARTMEAIGREVLRALRDGDVLTQVSLAAAAGIRVRRIQELWGSTIELHEAALRSVQVLALRGTSRADGFILAPAPTLRQLAALSREHAAFLQAQAKLARAYRLMAAAMRRPGAQPQAVPPLAPAQRSQELGDAYRAATAAFRDCSRRKEARRIRAECAERRSAKLASFEGWASAGDAASFTRFIAGVALRWEVRLKAAVDQHTDRLELLRRFRRSDLKRHWRDWKEAWSRVGPPTRPRSPPTAACRPGTRASPGSVGRDVPVSGNPTTAGSASPHLPPPIDVRSWDHGRRNGLPDRPADGGGGYALRPGSLHTKPSPRAVDDAARPLEACKAAHGR